MCSSTRSGLKPRCETNRASHWDEHPSHEALVYLTKVYAPYFAMTAAARMEEDVWGIVEVDTDVLDEFDMLPDEDFLAQVTEDPSDFAKVAAALPRSGLTPRKPTMQQRTQWFKDRLGHFAHAWEASANHLGTCAHSGAIPTEAITRVALFDPKTDPVAAMDAADPTISLLNYKLCSGKYEKLTAELMAQGAPVV